MPVRYHSSGLITNSILKNKISAAPDHFPHCNNIFLFKNIFFQYRVFPNDDLALNLRRKPTAAAATAATVYSSSNYSASASPYSPPRHQKQQQPRPASIAVPQDAKSMSKSKSTSLGNLAGNKQVFRNIKNYTMYVRLHYDTSFP